MSNMKKLFVRLILGGRAEYFGISEIKGKLYKVDICPYESAEAFISRMKEALQKQGLKS